MAENRIRKVDSTASSPSPTLPFGGPQAAGIAYDKGRKGLILAPDTPESRLLIPETFSVTHVLSGADAATAGNYGAFFIAPFGVEVVGVRVRFGVASSSGTLMVKKAPSGTATDSGTDVLSGTMSLAGTANTNVNGSLHGTQANRQLAAGDALGLVDGGTLTGLSQLVVTIELKRRPDIA